MDFDDIDKDLYWLGNPDGSKRFSGYIRHLEGGSFEGIQKFFDDMQAEISKSLSEIGFDGCKVEASLGSFTMSIDVSNVPDKQITDADLEKVLDDAWREYSKEE